MIYVAIVVAWLAIGAAVGLVQARRGHWRSSWAFYAIFGPLAILLALQYGAAEPAEPVVLDHGDPGPGSIDVLAGLDGSPEALHAATLALRLFGPRVDRVTLAFVLDIETGAPRTGSLLHPEPWPEEVAARAHLEEAAAGLEDRVGRRPGTVLLTGEPAATLTGYARDEGYDVVVAGTRGRGLSRALLGSIASRLARQSAVPVLLIPGDELRADDDGTEPASALHR